ncbi:V0D/AC39 family V-type ATPase subunit [Anaeromicropila populeti]|uniref:V/A-type H+-transporting ATPase subunit C n=1 Tax=Anaeromicropila populeti TaxID=37658 RepID=A0A1I6LB28_9FIRM|nr:V-type ATPase subunit [Anaeromicropila populeti]SFS00681.1 V/A-type H+-transporting ATPase subunit C [Anaeromicropila populeti]
MGNLLTYGGIITKIHGMSGDLISNAEYEQIIQLDSPASFIAYLKSLPGYHNIFNEINETSIHRGNIEEVIYNSLYMDYTKIYQFSTNDLRTPLSIIFFRYEINILKACLQSIHANNKICKLSVFADFFKTHSEIDMIRLSASNSLNEFIGNLKGSKYYELFTKFQNSNFSGHTYEEQLDVYFFTVSWRFINKKLKGESQKILTALYGTQIDLLNIMWIYRSKKYYELDTSDILALIIPVHYSLKQEQLTKLIETSTINEFFTILSSTSYKELVNQENHDLIEEYQLHLLIKNYKECVKKYPVSIARIFYYLFAKEQEINKLTTALECIRYKIPPEKSLNYINHT